MDARACACGCGRQVIRPVGVALLGEMDAKGVRVNSAAYDFGCAMRIIRTALRGARYIVAAPRGRMARGRKPHAHPPVPPSTPPVSAGAAA